MATSTLIHQPSHFLVSANHHCRRWRLPSQLELADPDFYKIGFVRSFRAYGVEFREGPDGYGVFASKDVEPLRRSRTDWDLRLACLLLYAFDCKDNFWQLYGDFLPSAEECTSLLLAKEEDLLELQDQNLASTIREQQDRALAFWEKNWHPTMPLKIKRLAREPERFIWAVSMAQSRCINMRMTLGALVQDANMFVPYADMLNHSFQPNCFFHWRFKDRMLEVMINAGQRIKRGDELTINYMAAQKNDFFMQRYGFSSPVLWVKSDIIVDLGFKNVNKVERICAALTIEVRFWKFKMAPCYCTIFALLLMLRVRMILEAGKLSNEGDSFVDGAVIAAARTLPTWSDRDMPPIPSLERKAVKELQEECLQMLSEFPTTSEEDQKILDSLSEPRRTLETAIKFIGPKNLGVPEEEEDIQKVYFLAFASELNRGK
nr:protein PLASTID TRANSCRIPTIONALLY ACTIVE 14 isoform X1 [Ipomoea trifida]